MKKQVKIWSVLLMIGLVSCYAAAVQKPAVQQAGTSTQPAISGQDVITASVAGAVQKPAVQKAETSTQPVIGGQDVITASDAGGGYLTTRDILIVIIIVLALVGLGVLL